MYVYVNRCADSDHTQAFTENLRDAQIALIRHNEEWLEHAMTTEGFKKTFEQSVYALHSASETAKACEKFLDELAVTEFNCRFTKCKIIEDSSQLRFDVHCS